MRAERALDLYTRTAHTASAHVISGYSTSFGYASRLLPRDVRGGIADVYALVRVADEIVDGPAAEAGLDRPEVLAILDALEQDTLRALGCGFSANLVVHAFAATARRTGIGAELVQPFFESMRMDATAHPRFDRDQYRRYIHGSAEVVGSMCLRVFALEHPGFALDDQLEEGARRLGAAFQKVNFLRDLADDAGRLGRSYIPGLDPQTFTDREKEAVVDEIAEDLAVAREAIARLPRGSRRATTAAAELFGRLNEQLRATPAAQLRTTRVSVPLSRKLGILANAAAGRTTV
ncbi:phytoene/squalene synthase family protein [Microbacterium sp. nov. GSS16]|uniref:phytoene/squalene synthase family protein n=1 Tax=Microbacterium sp. nov. GSS16 TaxID=3019890 RepID=UPI0023052B9F|nr:phytoene/squalene synthase family protein [Microbacterium sp. nov. GSS16]WCD91678.1 phytoene/squalene synthase family protein [Microbacterium sp. nov. GSS16]